MVSPIKRTRKISEPAHFKRYFSAVTVMFGGIRRILKKFVLKNKNEFARIAWLLGIELW